jgi:hypothetical protein
MRVGVTGVAETVSAKQGKAWERSIHLLIQAFQWFTFR